ncbi:MAG: class I SAM-dependent methyltransferase [Terrimicrobiaceae bacterium]|nr:class I SAM-dependent methyltransferase [Terrimicrobiaceae bacterium]
MTASNHHWNAIFSSKTDPELGWYESDASQPLKFLDLIPGNKTATIFLPGAGTSVLVDELLCRGSRLLLNDISEEALNKLKERTGSVEGQVRWLRHDISKPLSAGLSKADIWIGRAVLHFLLSEGDIQSYFNNLRSALAPEGHVLLAEFSTSGAPRCAGLDLHRYSAAEMAERLGPAFQLAKSEDFTFINPYGDPRPYVYALFKRTAT